MILLTPFPYDFLVLVNYDEIYILCFYNADDDGSSDNNNDYHGDNNDDDDVVDDDVDDLNSGDQCTRNKVAIGDRKAAPGWKQNTEFFSKYKNTNTIYLYTQLQKYRFQNRN